MGSSWAEATEAEGAAAAETATSDEAQPVSGASVSGESGEATSDKGYQSAPEPPAKKRHRGRNAPADMRRRIRHARKFRETEAEHAAFSPEFFNEWREWRRQEIVQKVSMDDARHRITYQFGQRTVDPTERKAYQKIPLVTEDDQQRFRDEDYLPTP